MLKAEVYLWTYLKGKQLLGYKFRRQFSFGKYITDFYCPKIKLAIEVDGESHILIKDTEYDRLRQKEIEALGIKFLRFNNEEMYDDMEAVLEKIKKFILTNE